MTRPYECKVSEFSSEVRAELAEEDQKLLRAEMASGLEEEANGVATEESAREAARRGGARWVRLVRKPMAHSSGQELSGRCIDDRQAAQHWVRSEERACACCAGSCCCT